MATIELSSYASTDYGAPSGWAGNMSRVYVKAAEIDLAEAATAKGSALAVNDVIEAIALPKDCFLLGGGVVVTEAMTGTSTDATIDVGVTGGTADALVDGFDLDGASAGDSAQANPMEIQFVDAVDTVDVKIATQTGTITGGKLRVVVLVAEAADYMTRGSGLAALGS